MRVLAGDIGGTNSRLGLFEAAEDGRRPALVVEEVYPSRDHPSLESIVERFVAGHDARCQRACFGIAGPVIGERVETTNLAWVVEARNLAAATGIPWVRLLNDLEANAWGVGLLEPADVLVLNPGLPGDGNGNAALVSAGTGLGEAGLYWDGRLLRPFASEGGHADFAPRSELEIELLRFLLRRHEHVSWERVLSGPGLVVIYEFLRERDGGATPAWLAAEMEADAARAVSQAALAGRCPVCVAALDLFVALYGAEAGNLGLKLLATRGVYLGGGIAPKIAPALTTGAFLRHFTAKGRMSDLVARMPVKVILNPDTALLGAAWRAALGDV